MATTWSAVTALLAGRRIEKKDLATRGAARDQLRREYEAAWPAPEPTETAEPTEPPEPTPQPTETAEPSPSPTESAEPSPSPTEEPDDDEHLFESQVDFASNQTNVLDPVLEHLETPAQEVFLDLSSRDMSFPDGLNVEMWVFHSEESGRGFPGPTLRPKEGEIFHATLSPSMGPHTIHWHGLEPDPRNDGVGHTSFEVEGKYTYQWKPEAGEEGDVNCGTAGTYFYHCHVNTPLHAQMGLLGPLIVDPVELPGFPVEPGTRRAFADGPLYDIETEAIIIPYSLDRRWHTLHHAAGLSGEDVGLNRFEPEHFYIAGGLLGSRRYGDEVVWAPTELPINLSGNGEAPTLWRLLDANYLPITMSFRGPDGELAPIAELIAHDGRPYRCTYEPGQPSLPTCMHPDIENRLMTHTVSTGAAERYDMLLHPTVPGEYSLRMDWHHWVTGTTLATRTLRLLAG